MNVNDIKNNLQNYKKFNRIKYNRFQQLIPSDAIRKIVNSVPLLLSVNNPKLPGYVQGKVPTGVSGYSPDQPEKTMLQTKFGKVSFDLNFSDPVVETLALIGSVGTIAYNKSSDFDYWVCIKKAKISDEEYKNFRKKVEHIQQWASEEAGTEIHLFINDIESVKNNIYDEDEDEAFGSTIGVLLKDEFFRSSVIVSGKTPFWWVVPVSTSDEEYEKIISSLPNDFFDKNFIDIGNLFKISKEEFIGAALFQIIKSLGNPFKSILKLGVLEKYLFQKENAPLISHKIKHYIHKGKISNTILDSYLMMFHEVYEYYSKNSADQDILSILKMNLYLKINPRLSKYAGMKNLKNIPYRVEEMSRYCSKWNWNIDDINDLDNFDNWNFTRVLQFWDKVQRLMLLSYQKISTQIPSLNLQNKISESDFKLLVRKIRAQYGRSEDKIARFISFKETKHESLLYIEPVSEGIKSIEWVLYKKVKTFEDQYETVILHKSPNLIKLMSWAVINNIYDSKFSRMTVQSGYQHISKDSAIDLLNQLGNYFTKGRMATKNSYIINDVFNVANFITLDFNIKDSESVQTIDYIYYTSWGESYIKHYDDENQLTNVMDVVIRNSVSQNKPFEDYCCFYCPGPYRKPYKEIISVFKESFKFITSDSKCSQRLISKCSDDYVIFSKINGKVESKVVQNLIQLGAYISLRSTGDIEYKFCGNSDRQLDILQFCFDNTQAHDITVFYEIKGNFLFTYIFNETGNLFIYFKAAKLKDVFLYNLYGFIENTLRHVRNINRFAPVSMEKTKFYELNEDKFGKFKLIDSTNDIQNKFLSFYSKKSAYYAEVNTSMGDSNFYNLKFPDGIESGFMTKDDFYAAAGKITAMKNEGMNISNSVNDVSFPNIEEDPNMNSTPFFQEKYIIELNIENTLKACN